MVLDNDALSAENWYSSSSKASPKTKIWKNTTRMELKKNPQKLSSYQKNHELWALSSTPSLAAACVPPLSVEVSCG